MGVRGLTTFVNSNSKLIFEEFQLHDCTVVVDGNSVAAILYSRNLGPHSAFGGDYDTYAYHVESFVKILEKCNIQAIFIFDGGYEKKKANTVRKRKEMKVYAIENITPAAPAREFYPLMLRSVIKERLISLGVTCLQSDFEADREIAAVAKRINAIVISNDSDFFIFDIPYIPLSTFPFDVCINYSAKNESYHYIPCQIFFVDKFLESCGGLDKSMLPLLASVLGNDYLNRSIFKNFYSLIKLDHGKKMTLGQRRVKGLVKWLKNETFDSALKKIISSLPKSRRSKVKAKINVTINSYNNVTTCLQNYLPVVHSKICISNICEKLSNLQINDNNISESSSDYEGTTKENIDDAEMSPLSNDEREEEEIASEDDQFETRKPYATSTEDLPLWLLERSRQCQIPPQVITLITLKTYFCVPQVEDCNQQHAGEIALPILRKIVGLVLGTNSVNYWHRHKWNAYRCRPLEYVGDILPTLDKLNKLSLDQRKSILLDAMNMENDLFLCNFPNEWQLLILSLVYWIKYQINLKNYQIHAVITMVIIVYVYQTKIGYFKKLKQFNRKYGGKVKSLEKLRQYRTAKFEDNREQSVINDYNNVTIEDCLCTFEEMFSNFNIDMSLKERPRTFSRTLIHCYAELQSVLDTTQILNWLLLEPFEQLQISKLYNGTFLYNMTTNFKQQPNIIAYLEKLFKKAPNILNLHMSIYNVLSKFIQTKIIVSQNVGNKRRRKKKKKAEKDLEIENAITEDFDNYTDENNKYSALKLDQL